MRLLSCVYTILHDWWLVYMNSMCSEQSTAEVVLQTEGHVHYRTEYVCVCSH